MVKNTLGSNKMDNFMKVCLIYLFDCLRQQRETYKEPLVTQQATMLKTATLLSDMRNSPLDYFFLIQFC